jgi:RNA 2',3'-cyclic 3'-phosphodiesterase
MATTAIPAARRLFIGLMPDRPVQLAIQRHCREWQWPEGAKPTRFGRYHITLSFLADVGLAPEQRLRKALREVTVEPLELELQIPELWRSGVAVLRPAAHDALVALQQSVTDAVLQSGLAVAADHDFKAHVTLARNAMGAVPPKAALPIRWRINEFALVCSVPFPQAKPARYDVVERFGVPPGREAAPPAPSGQSGEQGSLFG